jgi:hypothetical protein
VPLLADDGQITGGVGAASEVSPDTSVDGPEPDRNGAIAPDKRRSLRY